MKKVKKAVAALMLTMAVMLTAGCDKPEEPNNGGNNTVIELPQVLTTEVTSITTTSATCGGEIVSNGDGIITECGVCWSCEAEPTINDNFVMAHATTGTFTVVLDSLSSNTNYLVRAYAKNEAGIGYGNVVSFTTIENGGGFNDHEYVDLGLPSGTLWATCNVGASTPENYGDYFAWGETESKITYNWSTYKYCNGGEGWNTLTKYCNKSDYGDNGFIDSLTILQPSDDAATANWGSGWRLPIKEEWQELYNTCTHVWTTQNGVHGRCFTGPNGNSIFLPTAGYRSNSSLDDAGSCGYYWSSSLDTDNPRTAWGLGLYFNFNSGLTGVWVFTSNCDLGRSYGFSVRPVRAN